MAEALLSIPLQIAIEKFAVFIWKQMRLIASASDDVREIQDKLHSINAVLKDAERKQFTDESVRVWLLKLKGVALDIEDMVEEWQISSDYLKSYEVGVELQEIRKRLDVIHGDRVMSGFSSGGVGGENETIRFSSDWRQTSSLVEESDIIGRDEDKKTVIGWLVSDAEDGQRQQQEVHVAAIIGVGGLGKTTLAQQIFNDPKVKDHFNQAFYWVCVSDVFDVIELTKDILEAVNGAASSSRKLNVLQNELLNSLRGKRFLLVLDDVWNEVLEKWEILRLSLRSGERGSRILVTTRSNKVAGIMNASSRIHELKGLSDDFSLELFCRRAFPENKPEGFSEFESIGREIVKKCKGVPLSIKVMGSTMKTKTTVEDWKNILESEMWSLPQVKGGILPSLQLSYYHLPPHFKQCFAYCSIYPKDTVMKKNELVNLWVVQGFIRSEGDRVVEDIAEEYFNGLVARSMFQEVHEDDRGIVTCKMHDLLHDLATVITGDESYIFTESKDPNPPCSSIGGIRHASLILDGDNARISLASFPRKKLRTLFVNDLHEIRGVADELFGEARFLRALVFRYCWGMKVLPKAIGKLKHLRYLDLSSSNIAELPEKAIKKLNLLRYLNLSHSSIKKLPDAFGKMKNLRYLDLSWTEIEDLPESVSRLVNLHTLNLNRCGWLKKLCGGICNIAGLRHLYIEDTHCLKILPKGIGKLTSLQSLCKFIVGGENGEYCGIDELQELNALQGRLEAEGLDRVSEAEQAASAQLCKKHGVRRLVLDISSGERGAEDDKEEERIKVLECLRPHPNLQELKLNANSISKLRLPSWLEDPSFSNLSRLLISGFEKWEPNNTMPGLGKLPGLKELEIRGVGVRKLGDEFYYGNEMISGRNDVGKRRGVAFPKLESLTLASMDELEEWEFTEGEADASRIMPSLRELEVNDCPKLQLLPSHLATGVTPTSSSSSLQVPDASKNYCDDELKPLPPASEHVLKPLEHLQIFSCYKLQSLPQSLGQLKKLKSLSIWRAIELTRLPDSLGQLESLEKLEIEYCDELESLPQSSGGLKKLKSLKLTSLKTLESLPDSLGQLESLEILKICDCDKLKSLGQLEPSGQLKKLESLEISGARELTCLPDSLGQLESLQTLRIENCYGLESLPDSLEGLKKLKSLYIRGVKKLESLPDSLEQLTSLEYLGIRCCDKLKSLPHSLGRLQKLQELQIDNCPQLPYNSNGRREDWPNIFTHQNNSYRRHLRLQIDIRHHVMRQLLARIN